MAGGWSADCNSKLRRFSRERVDGVGSVSRSLASCPGLWASCLGLWGVCPGLLGVCPMRQAYSMPVEVLFRYRCWGRASARLRERSVCVSFCGMRSVGARAVRGSSAGRAQTRKARPVSRGIFEPRPRPVGPGESQVPLARRAFAFRSLLDTGGVHAGLDTGWVRDARVLVGGGECHG